MKYCDGVRDCEDGSDENQCPQNSTDFVEQFMCQNGAKIHKDKVCNGVTDCTDGSDEGNNCPTSETRSQMTQAFLDFLASTDESELISSTATSRLTTQHSDGINRRIQADLAQLDPELKAKLKLNDETRSRMREAFLGFLASLDESESLSSTITSAPIRGTTEHSQRTYLDSISSTVSSDMDPIYSSLNSRQETKLNHGYG